MGQEILKASPLTDLFGRDKVQIAIERLRTFEPPGGYYFADSGGKDSTTVRHLLIMSGVKYDGHYSVTTIDPPELIYFIRKHHPETIFERPAKPLLSRMLEKGFILRTKRWCCSEYKETGGNGRIVVTGIRAEESQKRAGRKMMEQCFKDSTKTFFNVIIDWTKRDVWAFIRYFSVPYCSLYDEGFNRIGCIMCPQNYYRLREAERWPRFKALFKKTFVELYKKNQHLPSYKRWRSGEEMFRWWLSPRGGGKGNPDQTVMFE